MLAWVDRANVSFAKLQMLSDLHFGEVVYGFGPVGAAIRRK